MTEATSANLKDNHEIIERMMHIPALKDLKPEDMAMVLKLSKIRSYRPGEVIFEEGAYANFAYYLVSGRAQIVKKGKVLVVLQRTGDIFGEIGAVVGSARSASATAIEDTVCVEIDLANLDHLTGKSMYFFRYMIFRGFAEILANRLRHTTDELVEARRQIQELEARLPEK